MRTAIKTQPAIEPVTLAEAKQFAKVTLNDDDTLIGELVTAARLRAELLTGRQLITATWYAYEDAFPCEFRLPYPPLISVTAITYTDTDGASQTLAASQYTVIITDEPGRIVPAYGITWPSTYDIPNAVRVEYVAGYGASVASVPAQLRIAIRQTAGYWYVQRLPIITGTIVADAPTTADSLFRSYWHGYTWQS